ncbi:lipase family alpha/beta hydrolase [Bacillus sp. 2205SS5-2]|uniref:lipase family alpha/beta hydrolase n=1 Tax=Bacillus sp. 2205SS5-2 TaxID=3109031 RepID=UPI0030053C7F
MLSLSKNDEYPVVFVPGIFGSVGEEIIPGSGEWQFGIAGIVYDPFICLLEETLEFKKGVNLFIAFYDWRKKVRVSFRQYLKKTIDLAKKKNKKKKVNIIAHGMGGLLARAYIESRVYEKDVNQLILIGTPNNGTAPIFHYWTSGKKLIAQNASLTSLLMNAYFILLSSLSETDTIKTIHQQFKGLHDLLPSEQYGPYLLQKTRSAWQWIQPIKMKKKNEFLNSLNQDDFLLKKRKVNVYLIAGFGYNTVEKLKVVATPFRSDDGKVIGTLSTDFGDGYAPTSSVFSIHGETLLLEGNHEEILFLSLPFLAKILNRTFERKEAPSAISPSDLLFFAIKGQGELLVGKSGFNIKVSKTLHIALLTGTEVLQFRSHSKQKIEIFKIDTLNYENSSLHLQKDQLICLEC